jgi:hypothetical protein
MTEPHRITTVGQLRAALQGIPDDTPMAVHAADPDYPEAFVFAQVITSTGFGLVDWGDGYGLEPDGVFALNCRMAEPEDACLPARPVRPARHPQVETAPEAEPEAGLW